MGLNGISKSTVSKQCKDIDECVSEFRKKGVRRSICASDSQKGRLIDRVSSLSLNHADSLASMVLEPECVLC